MQKPRFNEALYHYVISPVSPPASKHFHLVGGQVGGQNLPLLGLELRGSSLVGSAALDHWRELLGTIRWQRKMAGPPNIMEILDQPPIRRVAYRAYAPDCQLSLT